MMRANGSYGAPGWLPGGHAQTIYPVLIRRPEIAYRRQRIETPDGDFIDFDWLDSPTANAATPLVALFHGLEGNSRSHYALALMTQLRSIGWRGVVRISAAAAASRIVARAPTTPVTTPR